MPANSLGAQLVFLRNVLLPPVTRRRKQAGASLGPALGIPAQQPGSTSAMPPGGFNWEDRLKLYMAQDINYL